MASCRRISVAALAVGALLSGARPAYATPTFPEVIAAKQMSVVPGCQVCHVGAQQRGTVNTPFGLSLRMRGLIAFDEDSLRTALDALLAERTDSDGDGIGDVEELQLGTDPNAAPGDTGAIVTPIYGCASTHRGVGEAWTSIVAALALVAMRSRRR